MTNDAAYMKSCIELASKGLGLAAPNPLVGCLIVHNGEIIGSGYHERYGEPHAEIMALSSVPAEQHSLLQNSTLYVNLEPCTHTGKTPPCCDRIIEERIPRVVIGCRDVNKQVCGRGIRRLQESGAEVLEGVLQSDCQFLNRRFETYQSHSRPYVILKWAQTEDGFIAREDLSSKWISGKTSRGSVHRWRSQEPAILVGTTTAKVDNPKLNARPQDFGHQPSTHLRQPLRIVFDRNLSIKQSGYLFDQTQPTLVMTEKPSPENRFNLEFVQIQFDKNLIQGTLSELHARKISSLIVEGGSMTLQSFLEANLWDEARVFKSSESFTKGVPAPTVPTPPFSAFHTGKDLLQIHYRPEIRALLERGELPATGDY